MEIYSFPTNCLQTPTFKQEQVNQQDKESIKQWYNQYMNEMQKILKSIQKLEKGQESIRAEMVTKTEIVTLNKKVDAMQKDITVIRENTDVGSNTLSEDWNVFMWILQ